MGDDKIIRFPGTDAAAPAAPKRTRANVGKNPEESPPATPGLPIDPSTLGIEQQKALAIILGGMPFVLIGIKPTPSGADFFTAVHGDAADLRNAASHLPGVIERAYARKGV